MSSLFLFGAGASFGSGPCIPASPPLGKNLFSELKKAGGIAAQVDQELADLLAEDFEAGMEHLWNKHNEKTVRLLRDMAKFFAKFEPGEENLYIRLISALGGTRRKAVFATTNYDLLIEHAIVKAGYLISYEGLPTVRGNIPVLKIHGSCNFLPRLEGVKISGATFISHQSATSSIVESPVRIAQSVQEIIEFCEDDNSLAPALAIYHSSKRVIFCGEFVKAQQQAFQSALKAATRIYIIGLRVHLVDKHIWEPLAKSKGSLHYVGLEPRVFLEWAAESKRRNAFVLATSFEDAVPKIAKHHAK